MPCQSREVAYDEDLADRLRVALSAEDPVEKRMFGGLAFLVAGHMAMAASGGGGLLLRNAPTDADVHVEADGVERFVMRGREMDGWLWVAPSAIETDEQLRHWVGVGVAHVHTLPPKRPPASRS